MVGANYALVVHGPARTDVGLSGGILFKDTSRHAEPARSEVTSSVLLLLAADSSLHIRRPAKPLSKFTH